MDFSGEMADEILKIFQIESEEIINRLNNSLLLLEQKPNDKDAILLLFRDAHTLKGASRMVGFTNVQTVAHKMEDILGLAKENKIQITSNVINTLYQTVDFMSDLILKSIEKGKEIRPKNISEKLTILENIENNPEVASQGEETDDFNSECLINNANKINDLISEILFYLMSLQTNKQDDLIKNALALITELHKHFKEINHFEIKNTIEDIKAKLEFTTKASSELTSQEVDQLQEKMDDVISKIIPIYELYNLELVDYYSIAFEKAANPEISNQQPKIEIEKSKIEEQEILPIEDIISIEKEIEPIEFIEEKPKTSTNISEIVASIAELQSGTGSPSEIQTLITDFENNCDNKEIKEITKMVTKILDFISQNEISPDEDTISVLSQSLDYCGKILEGNADKANQEFFIQRLTIVQQVLEINQNQESEKKSITKGSFKIKNKLDDFPKIYNTGDIKTLRVDSEKLDTLINQVNELTVTKIKTQKHLQELKIVNKELEEWQKIATKAINYLKYYDKKYFQTTQTETPISFFMKQLLTLFNENNKRVSDATGNLSSLQRTIQEDDTKMGVIIDNLGNMVKDVRILPLATVFHLFGRMVRDIAQEKNKKIDLEIVGSETSTDKKIIEEIKTPLIHIIRNAIDHGIETPEERIALGKNEAGKIILSAAQKGNKVLIEIKDDGKGLNTEKIKEKAVQKGYLTSEEINTMTDEQITNIIFAPGFSTGDEITNISGRGIGLDVVQSKIAQLNGKVKMVSEVNRGCCVQIELPTTMSTIKAFLVKSGKQTFAIPMETINTVLRKRPDEIIHSKDKKSIVFKDKTVHLHDLAEILNLKHPQKEKTKEIIVILEVDNKIMALSVDKLIGDQEILHKKLSSPLYKIKNISGLTTLASGETCLILNITDIIKSGLNKKLIEVNKNPLALTSSYKILLVDDSITTRTLERNILQKAGYNIEVAQHPIEALEKMKSTCFDMIISDIEMPEMNGLEFLEKLKTNENYADIPVIMVSSLISEDYKKRAAELGAEKYIVKGEFEQDSFQETIKAILTRN